MKRILFLAAGLGTGGAERQITTVACLMKQAGYDVEVFCWNEENFFDTQLKTYGIPIHRVISNGVRRLFKVRSFIRKGRFDVVISFLPTPNFCNEFATLGGRSWKVITGERSSCITNPKTIRDVIFNYFRRFTDIQVCNSENAKRMWMNVSPKYSNRLRVIYNAVSIKRENCGYIPREGGKIHVLVTASIYKTKNPLGLLEAVKLMSDEERERIVVDWYGNTYAALGDNTEYFKFVNGIKDAQLEEVIRLHPATNNVSRIIQKSDFVALFSQLEGLPNAICEGMMLGKPVIMTKVSDFNIIVEPTNGYLCEWDKPETIKDALLNASQLSSDKIIEMGKVSKEKAIKFFSPSSISDEWVKIIEL